MSIENEDFLSKLEETLRRLKIQYDMFFAGIRKLPPTEDRKRIDESFREMQRGRLRDNASRFRYATLVQRYNQYQELWGRMMREKEEGPMDYRRRAAALAGKRPAPPPPELRPEPRVTSGTADPYIKVTPASNGDAMKEIHRQVAEANKSLGRAAGPSVEQITAMVQKQADELRSRYKVDTVAFRVELVDGKVKLKAKPLGGKTPAGS